MLNALRYIEDSIDLIFVSETCLSIDALPQLDGYKVISDPTIKICSHGGMAWYVKNYLSNHMSQITFGKSCISIGFNLCPGYIFIAVL